MLIDTHCHLDFPELSDDLDYWKTELPRAGLEGVIIPGVRAADWQRMQRFTAIPGVHLAYGLHPCFCNEHQLADLEQLEARLGEPGVVAIGEIGLDQYGEQPALSLQWDFLIPQLEMAQRLKLPVILHVRKAHEELVLHLRQTGFAQGGVVHAFSGSYEQAKRYLELGFKIGLGGAVTYEQAHRLHALVRQLHPTDFVLETDAPEMWPSFARDVPNTPLNLPRIAAFIADLRGEPVEAIMQASTHSAREIFPRLKLMGDEPMDEISPPQDWQERTRTILGKEGAARLNRAHVLVAGVGGVGGYAVEALVRAGVGRLTIIDADTVSLTNLNRQIIALRSTIGQTKVDVVAQRIADINPHCIVEKRCVWLTAETIVDELARAQPDYVIDCIDSLPAKIDLLETALRLNIPVIASMGTGGKIDPALLRLGDISKTTVCPLARRVRSGLRGRGITRGLEVVFSTESPIALRMENAVEGAQQVVYYGTVSFLPSTAGLLLAGRVIRVLAGLEPFPPSIDGCE